MEWFASPDTFNRIFPVSVVVTSSESPVSELSPNNISIVYVGVISMDSHWSVCPSESVMLSVGSKRESGVRVVSLKMRLRVVKLRNAGSFVRRISTVVVAVLLNSPSVIKNSTVRRRLVGSSSKFRKKISPSTAW